MNTNFYKVRFKKIKKRRLKKKNFVLMIILIIAQIIIIYSIYNYLKWKKDNEQINNQINKITETIEITPIETEENIEIIEQNADKQEPYWDYIKMNLIDVNFDELLKINNETIGWIQVNGTNINYPFVQTTNNDYYLNHSFDKSYNGGGWVFLDYRNDLSKSEKNTIIYGHGRQNQTIFGTLKNTLKNEWLENKDNHIIKLSTKYENTLWQIFSVYRIPTTNDYIRTKFLSDTDFKNFANKILERSIYDFNTTINETDQILTLSTCYNNDDKIVIHAKLIKKQTNKNDT